MTACGGVLACAIGGFASVVDRAAPPVAQSAVLDQMQALRSTDPIQRAFGACFLGRMGRRASSAGPALIALLGDGTEIDPVVCDNGHDWAWSLHALEKSSPGGEAAKALGRIGLGIVPRLLESMRSADPSFAAMRPRRWVLPAIAEPPSLWRPP